MKRPNSERQNTTNTLAWVFIIVVIFVIIVAFVLSIVGYIEFQNFQSQESVIRYCLNMNSLPVRDTVTGLSSGDDAMTGVGSLVIDGLSLSYDIVLGGPRDTLTTLFIRGPLSDASPLVAPVFLPSNGSSLTTQIFGTNTLRGAFQITELEKEMILSFPSRYYIILATATFIEGAIADRLGTECRPFDATPI